MIENQRSTNFYFFESFLGEDLKLVQHVQTESLTLLSTTLTQIHTKFAKKMRSYGRGHGQGFAMAMAHCCMAMAMAMSEAVAMGCGHDRAYSRKPT